MLVYDCVNIIKLVIVPRVAIVYNVTAKALEVSLIVLPLFPHSFIL